MIDQTLIFFSAHKPLLLVAVLGALMALDWVSQQTLVRSLGNKGYRWLVAPGIVLHELSHVAAAKLVGSDVKRVQWFGRHGGYVRHTKSPVPLLGDGLIAFAPIVGGGLALYLVTRYLQPGLLINTLNDWRNIHFSFSLSTLLWVYLVATIGATLIPSTQDVRNAWPLLFVVLAFAYPWAWIAVGILVIYSIRTSGLQLLPIFVLGAFVALGYYLKDRFHLIDHAVVILGFALLAAVGMAGIGILLWTIKKGIKG